MSGDEQVTVSDEPTVDATLDAVRLSTLDLLANLAVPPRAVRVQAGDVAIEMEWASPAGGTSAAIAPAATLPPTAQTHPAVGASPAVLAEQPHSGVGYLNSPTVGMFYRCPGPGAKPFVDEGDIVHPGQQLAIIEAMKLMLPVESDRHARVVEVLQPDASSVEYGQPLFALAPVEP